MDLRTFLPPPPIDVEPLPGPGDAARELPLELEGRAAVIVFLRHTGCPFAEATFRRMGEAARRHPDLSWVAVSHASGPATRAWCETVAGGEQRAQLVIDQPRRLYAAWGLGRSTLGHFMGGRSLVSVARLARQGIRNRHPHGTRWQSAGAFAVGADGTIRWRHVPEHAGDLPDLEEAARAALSAV
jgi:hypothetical protein